MLDIDWSKIRSISDVLNIDQDLLYDESKTLRPVDMLQINPTLTEEEIEDAFFWKDYNNGLILVTGEPGAGKGIFSHMLAYKLMYYFHKIPIVDTRPRKAFGQYIPFSEAMLAEQVERMSEMESGIPRPYVVKGLTEIDYDKNLSGWEYYKASSVQEQFNELKRVEKIPQNATLVEYNKRRDEFVATVEFKPYISKDGKWITSRGEVFLRNSTVLMDEFGNKYMGRLDPPTLGIKKVLLKEFNFHRHLNSLMLGVGVSLDDFDRKCLDKATHEARCVRVWEADEMESDPEAIIIGVYLSPIKYDQETDRIIKVGRTEKYRINASTPRHMLGGLAFKDVYNTQNSQGFSLPAKMVRRS